jgi:putative redox protein
MKANVVWQKDLSFKGTTESGFEQIMDGNGEAISPMESVLLAMGSCSSIDVVAILQKSRLDISLCECELDATRAENAPKVFTKVHAHYRVSGKSSNGESVSDKAVARAVSLSADKYCSVMLMLANNVEITTSYDIV